MVTNAWVGWPENSETTLLAFIFTSHLLEHSEGSVNYLERILDQSLELWALLVPCFDQLLHDLHLLFTENFVSCRGLTFCFDRTWPFETLFVEYRK